MFKTKKISNKQDDKYKMDDEIIIGYNTKKHKDNPPKSKKKVKKKQKYKRKVKIKQEDDVKLKKRKRKRKKNTGKLKKMLKLLLKIIIVIAIAAGIILFLFVSPVFNIQEIVVTGAETINEDVYIAMSGIQKGDNIFGVDKTGIIVSIKKEPYVETVKINSIYPSKIEINITERKISYTAEQNGIYYYIDKHGYVLGTSVEPLDYLLIKGYTTNLETKKEGDRIEERDFSKFNDLIKIVDAIQSNDIGARPKSIDVSDESNYILEFPEEKKNIMLGDASDLSAKMAWINFFFTEKRNESGNIYLNVKEVYFSPSN